MRPSRSSRRDIGVVVCLAASAVGACGTRTDLGDGYGDPFAPPGSGDVSGGGVTADGYRPVGDEGILVRGDEPPDEAADFDFSGVEDPPLRQRYEECAGYCEVIMVPRCPARPISEDFVECLRSCADRRDRQENCAAAVSEAFRCVAESGDAIACDGDGNATLVCGPCDREFGRVARRCGDDEVRCQFL